MCTYSCNLHNDASLVEISESICLLLAKSEESRSKGKAEILGGRVGFLCATGATSHPKKNLCAIVKQRTCSFS